MKKKFKKRILSQIILFLLILTSISSGVFSAANPVNNLSDPDIQLMEDVLGLDDGYLFTGLIDLTIGLNKLEGFIEPVTSSDQYQEGLYLNGRLAFYLKGKIRGETLLTAWLDTGEEPLGKLLQNLTEQGKSSIFEKLNSEKYYPIYGDNSTVQESINTQGKLYIKIAADDYQITWGNYRTDFTGSELISYNRSLYGLYAKQQNKTTQKENYAVQGFIAKPGSLHSRDELFVTGGMLYYLKHGDLLIGSEGIKIEARDYLTGRVLEEYQLNPGIDYEIDYLQGRLIVKKELTDLLSSNVIIKDENKPDRELFLVAEYDYEPAAFFDQDVNLGFEISYDINENLSISEGFYKESATGGEVYNLFGTAINYSKNGLKLNLSWAEADNTLSGKYISEDGGLSYDEIILNSNNNGGQAYKISSNFNLKDLYSGLPDTSITNTYNHWDKGFSNQLKSSNDNRNEYELGLKGQINQDLSYSGRFITNNEKQISTLGIKGEFPYSEKIKLGGELQGENTVKKNPGQAGTAADIDPVQQLKGAVRVNYQLAEGKELYASQQLTLYSSNNTIDNRTTLGTTLDLSEKLSLDLEGSTGNFGENLKLGSEYNYGPGKLYTAVNLNNNPSGGNISTTFGNRGNLNEDTTLYTERRIDSGEDEASTSDVVGLDYSPAENWQLTFDYTRSDVNKKDGEKIVREVITPGVNYQSGALNSNFKLQYRNDQGQKELRQYILTTGLKYQLNRELYLITDMNYALTREGASSRAENSEANLGLAYRPIETDRLNLLGKYTYLANSAPDEQENVAEYEESAQVLSLEGIYDISPQWQLAEKLAFKKAVMVLGDRGNSGSNSVGSSPYNSDTYLWVNRLNYRFRKSWGLYGEYRILKNTQARDQKSGFLLGVNKDLTESLQLGLGYNFTDFNDDLTELNYKARGLFVNLVQKW